MRISPARAIAVADCLIGFNDQSYRQSFVTLKRLYDRHLSPMARDQNANPTSTYFRLQLLKSRRDSRDFDSLSATLPRRAPDELPRHTQDEPRDLQRTRNHRAPKPPEASAILKNAQLPPRTSDRYASLMGAPPTPPASILFLPKKLRYRTEEPGR